MKKTIICILPMALALLSAGAFRFMKWYEKQVPAVVVSKTYWGFNIEQISDEGNNRVFILLHNKRDGAIIGNIKEVNYTFHF